MRAKKEDVKALMKEVEKIVSDADNASPELIDRLDDLLISLTDASRDVCKNIKCPHYNKKCKMR